MRPLPRRLALLALSSLLCALPRPLPAQVVAVPNPSFEEGTATPAGWSLSAEPGRWIQGLAGDGQRALAITGDGQSDNYWRSTLLPLDPGAVYQLSFLARGENCTQGTPTTGPIFCNRDLGRVPGDWTAYRSVFVAPERLSPERAWLRFGQWHADGTLFYDRVGLTRVQPVYTDLGGPDGLVLGEGEEVQGNEYRFTAPFRSTSANHSRPLASHDCDFNTDRWVFGSDSRVTYLHQLAGRLQLEAAIEVTVGYHETGALAVEASRDGHRWVELGTVEGLGTGTFEVPAELLPAERLWVLLRAASGRRIGAGSDPGAFQVHGYAYRARLDGPPVQGRGTTRFAAVLQADPRLAVAIRSLGDALPGGRNAVSLTVENRTTGTLNCRPVVHLARNAVTTAYPAGETGIPPGTDTLSLPYEIPGAGTWDLEVALEGEVDFRARVELFLSTLYESAYGARLPASSDEVGLWWASSGWKVSRTRPVPEQPGTAVEITVARGEAEAAQVVLRPTRSLLGLTATATDLTGPLGNTIAPEQVEVLRVRYVPVTQPTDQAGAADWWPDPLPPLRRPLNLAARQNQPLWVRVTIPESTAPGRYQGSLHLTAAGYAATVPLEVEVFDFGLPRRPTCTTAFGFSWGNVVRYQGLATEADRRRVLDLYLRDFSSHRIAPYDPAPMDRFQVSWEGLTPRFAWEGWDAAMTRAIDTLGFNSFDLPVQGLGGGTFHDRREPELLGYREDTPEYQEAFGAYLGAVEEHLAARGWLDEAYVYWFDEPDPKDYDFVMNGFAKLQRHGPRIRRMLTEQPEPALVNGPNVWCPVSDAFDPDRAGPRMVAGETFWWYVCTGPKAPYAGLFIDHPATELRVWLWQTWQRGIKGILVWETNYWTSEAAYPEGVQNPYEDPMGWVSGYSAPAGARQAWGNGDGRFIYPPEAAAEGTATGPVLEGPVASIRWEMLRDGVEDYEYLVILRDLLAARPELPAGERQALAGLLEVPASITSGMTSFTTDPAPMEARRLAVARAIERLAGKGTR